MILFPKMPNAGTNKISGIYNTVRDIVNLLPKLAVVGDNKTTFVEHSPNGTMVRAKPVTRGGISAGGDVYNGHFNIYMGKDSQNRDLIHITGGYFSVNGLVSSINNAQILASEVITSSSLYYAVLEIEYNKNTKQWVSPAFKFYNAYDFARGADYKCKFPIGEIHLINRNGQRSYQVTCYKIQYPVLIVGGDCTA